MKKMHILLLGVLPILLLLVTCGQDTPTSVSPSGVDQTEINALSKANNQEVVRWDIATVDFPFLNPGGSASALAEDDSKITITGFGTFGAHHQPVTGGGTWETFDSGGSSTGSGTYEVTNFVSFHAEPIGTAPFPPLSDNIGDPAKATAGLVYLTIDYSDGSQGVLVIGCSFAGSPPETLGGLTASKGPVNFWNRLAASPPTNENLTIFHFLPAPAPDIAADPTELRFDSLHFPASPQEKDFTLRNDGGGNLEVTRARLAGSNGNEFELLNLAVPFTLRPGERLKITVRFSPTRLGKKHARVKFSSNDPDEDPFVVKFRGAATDPH